MVRHTQQTRRFKQERIAKCEACGWRPPSLMVGKHLKFLHSLMHAHHIVPLSCGGADDRGNLILLCPNCHAIAHRLGSVSVTNSWPEYAWSGAVTKKDLLIQLRMLIPQSYPSATQIATCDAETTLTKAQAQHG